MSLNWPSKDPDELLDYQINWTVALAGDTIISSTWQINSADLINDHDTYGPNSTVIWLTGGVLNQSYQCTNTINTAGGRIFQQTVGISIRSN